MRDTSVSHLSINFTLLVTPVSATDHDPLHCDVQNMRLHTHVKDTFLCFLISSSYNILTPYNRILNTINAGKQKS